MNVFQLTPNQFKLASEVYRLIQDNSEMIHVFYRPRLGVSTMIDTCAAMWNYRNDYSKTAIVRPYKIKNNISTPAVKYVYEGESLAGNSFGLILVDAGRLPEHMMRGFVDFLNTTVLHRKSPGGKVVVFAEGKWTKELSNGKEITTEAVSLDGLDPMRMLTVHHSDLKQDW